jgi:hypothetical protein
MKKLATAILLAAGLPLGGCTVYGLGPAPGGAWANYDGSYEYALGGYGPGGYCPGYGDPNAYYGGYGSSGGYGAYGGAGYGGYAGGGGYGAYGGVGGYGGGYAGVYYRHR